MNSNSPIIVVLGVSSVGKSTYIESRLGSGQWDELPVIMAHELEGDSSAKLLARPGIVHYNLFRPYNNSAENLKNDITSDMALMRLLEFSNRIESHFLVAPKATVAKRSLLREFIEPDLREASSAYPTQKIFEILCRIDLVHLYRQYFSLFQSKSIDFRIINSYDQNYEPVRSEHEAFMIMSDNTREPYSKKEIDFILQTNTFEYQKIELCTKDDHSSKTKQRQHFGGWTRALKAAGEMVGIGSSTTSYGSVFTEGADRSPSLSFLDADLSGKSVLDIGCAYGYFCFEAERRNAARVVGTELKQHRFIGCNIIKEINNKKSVFLRQNIFEKPIDDSFDVVLLLNVIHHLPEPIKALRMAAGYCRNKMIIEFPTLMDSKFQSTLSQPADFTASLPLIGVSLLSTRDQTFLFSEEAVRRILMDHGQFFSRIDFVLSPMSNERRVAICHK